MKECPVAPVFDTKPATLKKAEEQLKVRRLARVPIKGVLHEIIDRPTMSTFSWLLQQAKKKDGKRDVWDKTQHPLNSQNLMKENKWWMDTSDPIKFFRLMQRIIGTDTQNMYVGQRKVTRCCDAQKSGTYRIVLDLEKPETTKSSVNQWMSTLTTLCEAHGMDDSDDWTKAERQHCFKKFVQNLDGDIGHRAPPHKAVLSALKGKLLLDDDKCRSYPNFTHLIRTIAT